MLPVSGTRPLCVSPRGSDTYLQDCPHLIGSVRICVSSPLPFFFYRLVAVKNEQRRRSEASPRCIAALHRRSHGNVKCQIPPPETSEMSATRNDGFQVTYARRRRRLGGPRPQAGREPSLSVTDDGCPVWPLINVFVSIRLG